MTLIARKRQTRGISVECGLLAKKEKNPQECDNFSAFGDYVSVICIALLERSLPYVTMVASGLVVHPTSIRTPHRVSKYLLPRCLPAKLGLSCISIVCQIPGFLMCNGQCLPPPFFEAISATVNVTKVFERQ